MIRHTPLKHILVLNSAWIGLSFMWNALHPLILPAVLLRFVPDGQKNTVLGVLIFSGAIIAMGMQPLAGFFSDHWVSHWGRRRPLLLLGMLCSLVFLGLIGWAGSLAWLFAGYIGLQLSANLAQGALQGLLPDLVTREQMGQAASIKTFIEVASLVAAALLVGHMLDPVSHDASQVILVMMAVLVASATVTLWGSPEQATHGRPKMDLRELLGRFRLDPRENPSYWWLTAERALFLLGVTGMQTFLQYYLQDVLRVPNPVKLAGTLLATIIAGVVVLVLVGGWLTDRFGAKKVTLAGTLLASAGLLLMMSVRDITALTVSGSVFGAGLGLFLTANWAFANQLAPPDEAGKYLGLTSLAAAMATALSRLEGPLIDLLNRAHPGLWLGYMGMFAFGALCTLASAILLNRVTIKERPATVTGMAEGFPEITNQQS